MRTIARLDIKGKNLIKGINFEGLRVIGDPNIYAKKYYNNGADELLLIDCVASLYGRNNLTEIIYQASRDIFIPITVGGGIRSCKDAEELFENGADKIAINSFALKNPNIINDLAKNFGSQAVVLSIQAKKKNNSWFAYFDNGREETNYEVLEWVSEGIDRGAGEILVTSIDNEGTMKGFDWELFNLVNQISTIPTIYGGGMSNLNDLNGFNTFSTSDGISIASVLHYNTFQISEIKEALKKIIK